jgi:hypothetical protein
MQLREDDFIAANSLRDVQDLVALRTVDLRRAQHDALDEREIWWALEAALRLLNQAHSETVVI